MKGNPGRRIEKAAADAPRDGALYFLTVFLFGLDSREWCACLCRAANGVSASGSRRLWQAFRLFDGIRPLAFAEAHAGAIDVNFDECKSRVGSFYPERNMAAGS